jgi:anti-anti-sigma factor
MRDSIDTVASYPARLANLPFDCNGAQVRAQCRHLANVVTISGAIDAMNVERITECCERFIQPDKPLVLDLSGVNCLAAQGIRFLSRIDDDCAVAGLEWALIASQPVIRVLRITDDQARFPVVGSVHEALHYFADAASARRRLLLPLLTKTA